MRSRRPLHGHAHIVLFGLWIAVCSCSCSAGKRGAGPTSPSPVDIAATGQVTAADATDETVDRSQPVPGRPLAPGSVATDVNFPPRDQALAFRQELEA